MALQSYDHVRLTLYPYKALCGSNPSTYSATCKSLAANSHYAAANVYPIGTRVTIRYKNRQTQVTVLDRGGGVPRHFGRWADISPAAMKDLGLTFGTSGATMTPEGASSAVKDVGKSVVNDTKKIGGSVLASNLPANTCLNRYAKQAEQQVLDMIGAGTSEANTRATMLQFFQVRCPQLSTKDVNAAIDVWLQASSAPAQVGPSFGSIEEALSGIFGLIKFALSPDVWVRVGMALAGAILFLVAIFFLWKRSEA